MRSSSLFRLLLALPVLLLGRCLSASAQAVTFYAPDTIQEVRLTFTQPNWDYQLDTAKAGSEGYILAAQCVINGVVFDSVGVKYKGNSSYNANNAKNPLHIELDYVKRRQDYQGIVDLKLANGFSDPSMIREVLAYSILANYMDAPRANFAKVYVNNAYYGLMTNVESVSRKFVAEHFGSSNRPFFKCTPPGGAGPGSSGAPDLRFLGRTPSAYTTSYELQTASGWNELINLCDTLNNQPAHLARVLDLDRAIWMLAFNNVLVNLDSYSGAFRQNYYLYQDADHRFASVMWDLNMSFGGFQMLTAGGGPGGGGGLDTTGMKNLAPGANSTSTNHPLIQKIWNTPRYKRMYIAHLKTIAEDLVGPGPYLTAQQWQARIQADYFADTHKFYTNAQFSANLLTAVANSGGGGPGGGGRGVIPGVLRLLTGRLNYLSTTPEFLAVAPTIGQPVLTPAAPLLYDTVWVTAAVGPAPTAVELHYRALHGRMFQTTAMYDDGRHHDGAANDGTYGAAVVANALTMEYYLYAENASAGIFAPRRAEHEFYTLTATAPIPPVGAVVVNELLADNVAGQTNPAGAYHDWIELYNATSTALDLSGLYLSDNPAVRNKWVFPVGTTIAPNGYLVVWADNDSSVAGELHANFKLSKSGEYVILSDGGTTLLDSVAFGVQGSDTTWGRYANGTGTWQRLPPTFGSENHLFNATGLPQETTTAALALFPNPATISVRLTLDAAPVATTVELLDATGRTVRRQPWPAGSLSVDVPTADLRPGIYGVRVGAYARRRLVVLR